MLDLGFLARWSSLSRWLLSFFGGCGIAVLLLLHSSDRAFVPGSTNIAEGWYRVGLFAAGNEYGKIDSVAVRALSELPDVQRAIAWSTQELNFGAASGEFGTGAFAFVAPDYLRLVGVQAAGNDMAVADGPEILLTSEGATAFDVSADRLPAQVKIGTRHFLVRTILPASYTGPAPDQPVLGLIHRDWLNSLVFPAFSRTQFELLPTQYLLVHAPSVSGARGLIASILASGVRSESPFLADTTRASWAAFQGPYGSPQEASAERLFRAVLLVISLGLFLSASLVYVVTDSLSNANLISVIAIRSALGEVQSDRTRWLFSMAMSRTPVVAFATLVIAVALHQAYVRSFDITGESSGASMYAYALALSTVLASVPMLMSFGCHYMVSRLISISDGLGGHRSRLLYDALASKLLFASSVLLSAIFSSSLVFFLAVSAFNSRPLGFDADGLLQASVVRPDSSPASRESGFAESMQIETLGQKLGTDLGVTTCAPLRSANAVTNLDTPNANVAAALICYATPGAISAMRLNFLSGANFAANDDMAAVVTSDFLSDVNGGGQVGSSILQEALGRPHRVHGIVRPVNLNASFGPSPPVAFINGSEFGLRGTLLFRNGKNGLADEISRGFGSGTRLGKTESVRDLIDIANADFLSQRAFALAASVTCAALCSLALIACCLLVLVAWRREIGIRLALGAQDAFVYRWALGGLIKHIGYGLAAGFCLAPLIGTFMNRILPVDATVILSSIAGSAFFCISIVAISVQVAVIFFVRTTSISTLVRQ